MIIEYVSVRSDTILDRITIDGDQIRYETGKARQMVENLIATGIGQADVVERLRSWSNGYVLTREVADADTPDE